jgi:hypothetical protein
MPYCIREHEGLALGSWKNPGSLRTERIGKPFQREKQLMPGSSPKLLLLLSHKQAVAQHLSPARTLLARILIVAVPAIMHVLRCVAGRSAATLLTSQCADPSARLFELRVCFSEVCVLLSLLVRCFCHIRRVSVLSGSFQAARVVINIQLFARHPAGIVGIWYHEATLASSRPCVLLSVIHRKEFCV